ncbi:DHA2 family efflux MFS transporter permease subunit [Kitasatospora sp. NPDC052896]|uniref:DHA2 family efflux MFS transporter permease subunit n=1 Tax=Kitasatospora sp. NPDC052896 TaxID=3364061 RepID=UPI0037C906E0
MRIALILVLGGFVALLDSTVVGVAVHTLAGAFAADLADTQWVTTGYLLALAAVIPATGWAARRFGATSAWLGSLGVFLVGSVLCGSAWSLGSLVLFRVVQGIGAGGLFPLSRVIVMEVAGRERLGRMTALMAVPVSVAPIVGPVAGGAVLAGLSWRWVFLLNVPILLAAMVLSALFIPRSRAADVGRLDVLGLLCVSGGITGLLFGLSGLGEGRAVTAPEVGPALLLGVALLGGYAARASRSSAPGVVELSLFRDRAFAASAALGFLANAGLFAAAFLVPLFYQQAGGGGALDAGLVLAPQGLGSLVAVLLVGRLVDVAAARARTMVLAGLLLVALGTVPFALVGSGSAHLSRSGALLLGALFVRGVGLAFAVAPTMKTLYHSLPVARVPAATTANAIGQQVGGAAGTAAVAVVLQRCTDRGGAVAGFHAAFWVTLGLIALAAAPASFLPDGNGPASGRSRSGR